MGNKIEIVVAHYNENLDWLDGINQRKTIYSKAAGGDLQNVGFEAQTFLHHFAARYDDLADVTVCLQGNPFPHIDQPLAKIIESINHEDFSFMPISAFYSWQDRDGNPDHVGLRESNEKMWQHFKKCKPPEKWFSSYGGQFAVHRDLIHARSQKYWGEAAEIVLTKNDACAVERMWHQIFF